MALCSQGAFAGCLQLIPFPLFLPVLCCVALKRNVW